MHRVIFLPRNFPLQLGLKLNYAIYYANIKRRDATRHYVYLKTRALFVVWTEAEHEPITFSTCAQHPR